MLLIRTINKIDHLSTETKLVFQKGAYANVGIQLGLHTGREYAVCM